MIGKSDAFLFALETLARIAGIDATVLIEGETGTGKELAARAIHYSSIRRGGPFVPVNCGAIPDTLVENELFGHRRGAFTDARHDCPGLIASAEGGTLFLDEIEALSPKAQVVLLRFLQDQHYRPIGGQDQAADLRIVAASNDDLAALARQGRFRLDLLYRLRLLCLNLPPLRERPGDARLLAEHFLAECARRYGKPVVPIAPSTLAWFDRYAWPGNVRELEHLVYREFLLRPDSELRIPPPAGAGGDRRCSNDRRREERDGHDGMSFKDARNAALDEFERIYLRRVLDATGGNVTRAAELAGKERRALGKLIKKHGIARLPGLE